MKYGPIASPESWRAGMKCLTGQEREIVRDTVVPEQKLRTAAHMNDNMSGEERSAAMAAHPQLLSEMRAWREYLCQTTPSGSSGLWGVAKREERGTLISQRLRILEEGGVDLTRTRQTILACYEREIHARPHSAGVTIDGYAALAEGLAVTDADQSECVRLNIARSISRKQPTDLRFGMTPAVCRELMRLMPEWLNESPTYLLSLVEDPAWSSTTPIENRPPAQAERRAFFEAVTRQYATEEARAAHKRRYKKGWPQEEWDFEQGRVLIPIDEVEIIIATVGVRCAVGQDTYGNIRDWWNDLSLVSARQRGSLVWEWLNRLNGSGMKVKRGSGPTASEIFAALAGGIEHPTCKHSWLAVMRLCHDTGVCVTWDAIASRWETLLVQEGAQLTTWLAAVSFDTSTMPRDVWKPVLRHPDSTVREYGIRRLGLAVSSIKPEDHERAVGSNTRRAVLPTNTPRVNRSR